LFLLNLLCKDTTYELLLQTGDSTKRQAAGTRERDMENLYDYIGARYYDESVENASPD